MSLHRRAAKRDAAEPGIVSALEALGCVVWRVSGKGLPDLVVLRAGKTWLADVKGPKEKPTPAQEELWEEAATKARCAVFILRTPEDAAAMLNNALQPWEPEGLSKAQIRHGINRRFDAERTRRQRISAEKLAQQIKSGEAAMSNGYEPPRTLPVDVRTRLGTPVRKAAPHYFPPASPPLDAAKEAEVTFAPCSCGECAKCKAWSSVFSPR